MAEYNGKQGRWITTKEGKHLFIEDEVDKQEREIKESKAKQDAFNKDKEDDKEDIVASNPLFKGLKIKAEKALAMPENSIEDIRKKENALYLLIGDFKDGTADTAIYDKVEKEQQRLELAIYDYLKKTHGGEN